MSSPSPLNESSPAAQLTPRSKIKALLAAVDDESASDDRENVSPVKSKRKPLAERDQNFHAQSFPPQRRAQPFEDDDELPVMPQGKLARQLQSTGLHGNFGPNEAVSEGSDDQETYKRVRRRLMTRKPGETVNERPVEPKIVPEENASTIETPAPTPISRRGSSPGLFLTPTTAHPSSPIRPERHGSDGSESDLPVEPTRDSKFLELVAQKREQRKAREAEAAARKRMEKKAQGAGFDNHGQSLGSDASGSDIELDRRLTQQDRPARKASKKALEEMSRETQRLSRNMQLAHQAKTKKKITKESLLARFNFGAALKPTPELATPSHQSNNSSSNPASDHDDSHAKDTPPTSPLVSADLDLQSHEVAKGESETKASNSSNPRQLEELPEIADILIESFPAVDQKEGKVEGKAAEVPEVPFGATVKPEHGPNVKRRAITFRSPKLSTRASTKEPDSDSDLEILPIEKRRSSRVDAFTRVPRAQKVDTRPLQKLRALAHLASPPNNKPRVGRRALNQFEMQSTLQKKARLQALELQRTRIEELRAKGICIQTQEEKQKEQLEVEDLLEKARKQDEALREKEKRAAKTQKMKNGDTQSVGESSDEDDEDYEEGKAADADSELSGSADDELDESGEASGTECDGTDLMEQEGDFGKVDKNLIEDEAVDDPDDEAEVDAGSDQNDGSQNSPEMYARRPRRVHTVIDDEEETQDNKGGIDAPVGSSSRQTPSAELPNFFRERQNSMALGMTQAFAATMADTQSQPEVSQIASMPFETPPEPHLPFFPAEDSLQVAGFLQRHQDSAEDLATQVLDEETADTLPSAQPVLHCATQFTEMPDPTQDAGFVLSSPGPEQRFVSEPPSTVATVIVDQAKDAGSPVPRKRGRLQRGQQQDHLVPSDAETGDEQDSSVAPQNGNAFSVMKMARKRAREIALFDKKKSEAKDMIEEQAQESDDEYAGLGGASDEDSGGEDDELVKEMIDQGEVDVDERKLAALYADKQRVEDDKAIQKLFKDINNGGLRRKRNNEFDLSESDDDGEARRRKKQREFAKMRKALIANENVGKIAEDPKKSAFFKAIEDRDVEDLDFLADRSAEDSFRVEMDTQDDDGRGNEPEQGPPSDLATVDMRQDPAPEKPAMRPPPSKRRIQVPKRPSTLAEIKDSVSFLTEDPAAHPNHSSSSSSDEDDEVPQTPYSKHTNPRRTSANSFIDRLTLKRESSSSISTSAGTTTAMAFHAPTVTNSQFVPSLLRRATTSSLSSTFGSGTSGGEVAAATERAAGGRSADFVGKKGGGKRSSVNFAVREGMKQGIVDQVDRRRKEAREKMAVEREKVGLSGLRRSGTWD